MIMMFSSASLPPMGGARVLVVEDNFLVATDIALLLESLGCTVLGPAATVEEALSITEHGRPQAAVLDINIIGGTSVPVAESLIEKRIPFFFVTGYASPKVLPESLKRHRRLNKPVDVGLLGRAIDEALGRSPSN